jgi:Ser/Thr protein kinase RdoA (MazF antagonist)
VSEGTVKEVLVLLGISGARRVRTLKDLPSENGSWLVDTLHGERVVLRRYHYQSTADDVAYEHAVLKHLSAAGWVVPVPSVTSCVTEGFRTA